jgi:CDP-glucose 4,6-dehydratase
MTSLDFWRGRRIFLTGHSGFKGAWLSLLLAQLGASVTGYSLAPPTRPSLFELADVGAFTGGDESDVRDLPRLRSALADCAPDVVIHMAAQSLVGRSYEEPIETFTTNVIGTANVLEAVRVAPSVRAVVIVTSDKCYDLGSGTSPRKELDPIGGVDPYSASKASAEIVTAAYRQSFFGSAPSSHPALVASVRSGNVIAGGDWSNDRIVVDIVRALEGASDLKLRYPDAIRPWTYVLDTLRGYLMLAERLHNGEADLADGWNFGPTTGSDMSVTEFVKCFAEAWGQKQSWHKPRDEPLPESLSLRLDSTKAVSQLGWQPLISQKNAIRETASWFRSFLIDGTDPARLCNEQIDRFLSNWASEKLVPEHI